VTVLPRTRPPTTVSGDFLFRRIFGVTLIGVAMGLVGISMRGGISRGPSELLVFASLFVAYIGSRGATPVLRVYVVFVALWFVLPPFLGLSADQNQLNRIWVIVAIWLLSWTGGQLLLGYSDRPTHTPEREGWISREDAVIGLTAIGLVAMAIQMLQIVHGATAYTQQVSGITDTSISGGTANLAGPALVAAFIMSKRVSPRSTKVVLALLIGIEALLLTQNGFRAAAVNFLFGGLLAYIAVNPPSTNVERRAIARWFAVLILVGIPLILIGSSVRQSAQAKSAYGGIGHTITLVSLPHNILTRWDETSNLAQSLVPLGPQAHSAVSVTHQFEDFVPRPLWPGKPIFDYGEQVSTAIYGLPASYHTSSTVTWLGDLYLNGGPWLILASGVVLGAAVRRALQRATRNNTLSTIFTVSLVSALFDPENPIVLAVAGIARTVIFLSAACIIVHLLRPIIAIAKIRSEGSNPI
jgi:hypothetical protein